MVNTLSELFELLRIFARYGLLVLVLIDALLIITAAKRGIDKEITIFNGFLGLHYKYGIWRTNCAKVFVSILVWYPPVIFGRIPLFLL